MSCRDRSICPERATQVSARRAMKHNDSAPFKPSNIKWDAIVLAGTGALIATDHGCVCSTLPDFHVVDCQEKTHLCWRALWGARKIRSARSSQLAERLRSRGPCLCRTRHPFAVLGRCRPSQVIEFVFAASPETTRREPQEFPSPSPVAAGPGSLLAVDLLIRK